MPNINIPVSEELLRAVRVKCAETGLSQRQIVVEALEEALNGPRKAAKVKPSQGVSGVRGAVRDDSSEGKRTRGTGAATVQRPSDDTPANSGAVGNGPRENSGREGIAEKRYLGPAHAKMCRCPECTKIPHNPLICEVVDCGLCRTIGYRDAKRGL